MNLYFHCPKSVVLDELYYTTPSSYTEHGFKWTTEQIKIVFQSFDKDKSGSLIYDEFLLEIRGITVDLVILVVVE